MSEIDVNQVLQQMRSMSVMASNKPSLDMDANVTKPDFGELIKDTINKVNQTQKTAGNLATAFEAGDPSVNLGEVMLAVQKASVSFQAMTQVRNNLVSAYKEVMNMQV